MPTRREAAIAAVVSLADKIADAVLAAADAATPVPAPVPQPAPSLSSNKGVCVNLADASNAELAAALDDIALLGAGWIRMDFNWNDIQPSRTAFAPEAHERVVAAAQARGIRVLGVICYSAKWANGNRDQMFPPTSPADFAAYAGKLAARFKGKVAAWEVWNEANLGAEFWRPKANVAAYTALLKAAYPAIKAADPAAIVLTAGTSPAATDGTNYDALDFIKGVYAAGGRPFFDAVAVHPYTYPAMPDATDGGAYWWLRSADIYKLMSAQGDSAKKVWMTEFGAPTKGDDSAVTEAKQAVMLALAFRLRAALPWAGPLLVYEWQDSGTSAANTEDNFGLCRPDRSPKPAWATFQGA